MNRTRIAALQAGGAAFVLVAGTAAVAGFDLLTSAIAGLVCAVLGALLLLGAAARAGTAADDPAPRGTAPRADATASADDLTAPAGDTNEDSDRG